MKFVALLSGGKDSCFNITHCQRNGHQLVAAASLRPSQGIDELDSYLYQTVGQDAIEFVAQALDVPLYRRVIIGTAVQMENEYGTRKGISESTNQAVEGDETEDMYQLLKEVLIHHPEIDAVSVGAILSTYQRIRVEHVSVPSLAIQALPEGREDLLQEMIDSDVNAVLIKVAGIGLKPQHLGLSLAQMQSTLKTLHSRFGSHICGEGGEYETLTLDCPAFVKRIVLTETETVIQEDKGFATVAYWRIKSAELQEKPRHDQELPSPSSLSLLDDSSKKIYAAALALSTPLANIPNKTLDDNHGIIPASVVCRGRWIAAGNVCGGEGSLTIEEETERCFENLRVLLSQHGSDFTAIVHINALLGSITEFAAFNSVYSKMFGTSPPARACVAVNLPRPHRVVLECLAFSDASASERLALHVQGISYWAPANIGPYSQAIGVDGLFHVSGQIGLMPPIMALPAPLDVAKEVALSLQHVRRIREVLPLTSSPEDAALYLGVIIWASLTETLPALVAAFRLAMRLNGTSPASSSEPSATCPPVLFVVPIALPKDASVEIQTIFQAVYAPDDGHPNFSSIVTTKLDADFLHRSSELSNGRSFTISWFNQSAVPKIVETVQRAPTTKKPLSLRIYCSIELPREITEALRLEAAVTVIPVQGVFSISESEDSLPVAWDLAVVSLVP